MKLHGAFVGLAVSTFAAVGLAADTDQNVPVSAMSEQTRRQLVCSWFRCFPGCGRGDTEECLSRTPSVSPGLRPFGPAPVPSPGMAPAFNPEVTVNRRNTTTTTTLYAIGDVPYSSTQAARLGRQMRTLPRDAEFVVHVGDVRDNNGQDCLRSEFRATSELLQLSHAPVFVILGDNDHNDCRNREEGLQLWKDEFLNFESKHWDHNFAIKRQAKYSNWAFVHKGTLNIGLNIIGGEPENSDEEEEWSTRLSEQFAWTKELIQTEPGVSRVVIYGHADPEDEHDEYFVPLRRYIRDELDNGLPILYLNGDGHEWKFEQSYLDQESLLRIMVSGKARDPPLKLSIDANGEYRDPKDAFVIDRQL